MTQITKRVDGQVVQTDDANEPQTTQQLAKLAGTPVAPITPVGTAAQGANPDQAKMAGTPAQKAPVLDDAVSGGQQEAKPDESLATAQRTQTARETATDTESEAAQKAAQIQQLGSLSTRVQGLINNQLTIQQAATNQLNDAQMATVSPALKAQWTQLISTVAANPTDQKSLASASDFWVKNGMGTLDQFRPEDWFAKGRDTLGTQAASAVTDSINIGQAALDDNEKAALDTAFGAGKWQEFTPAQLAQNVEQLRQNEFSKVQAIRAELASAEGPRRAQLLQQLADAGQIGATGVEHSVKAMASQVAAGDTVMIGGEEHKVEDLLKDDQISKLVGRMLDDPSLMAKVQESNPDFAKWVTDNKKTLADLASTSSVAQGQVESADAGKHKLADIAPGVRLSDDVMRKLDPNWDTIGAGGDVQTGFFQVLKDPKVDQTTRVAMATAVEAMSKSDPTQFAALQKLDATGVKNAYAYGQTLDNDTTGIVAKLTGLQGGPGNDFILDPKMQKNILKFGAIADAFKTAGVKSTVYESPLFVQGVKSGDITADSAKALAAHPERLDDYKAYAEKTAAIQSAYKSKNVDQLLALVVGDGVTAANVSKEEADLKRMAALDPTDKVVQARLAAIYNVDINKDGKIDSGDLAGLQKAGTGGNAAMSMADIIGKGAPKTDGVSSTFKTVPGAKSTPFMDQMESMLKDGKVDDTDIAQLEKNNPSMLDKLWAMPAAWQKEHKVESKADHQVVVEKTAVANAQKATAAYVDQLSDAGNDLDWHTINSLVLLKSADGNPQMSVDAATRLITRLQAFADKQPTPYEKAAVQGQIDGIVKPYLAIAQKYAGQWADKKAADDAAAKSAAEDAARNAAANKRAASDGQKAPMRGGDLMSAGKSSGLGAKAAKVLNPTKWGS